jgi:hypothetical protein
MHAIVNAIAKIGMISIGLTIQHLVAFGRAALPRIDAGCWNNGPGRAGFIAGGIKSRMETSFAWDWGRAF